MTSHPDLLRLMYILYMFPVCSVKVRSSGGAEIVYNW
jgi:hypothetical protein